MDRGEIKKLSGELKKALHNKDFRYAVHLADSVDLDEVRDTNFLILISDAYEITRNFEQAKEILLEIYEHDPGNRGVAYRLSSISIKMNNIREARNYYDDFVRLAPRDNARYVLKYRLAKAGGKSLDQQIKILEEFVNLDAEERWAYELAVLYRKNDQNDKCIDMCDNIARWFSKGKYVNRAMDLKMELKPLTSTQMENYLENENMDKPVVSDEDIAEYLESNVSNNSTAPIEIISTDVPEVDLIGDDSDKPETFDKYQEAEKTEDMSHTENERDVSDNSGKGALGTSAFGENRNFKREKETDNIREITSLNSGAAFAEDLEKTKKNSEFGQEVLYPDTEENYIKIEKIHPEGPEINFKSIYDAEKIESTPEKLFDNAVSMSEDITELHAGNVEQKQEEISDQALKNSSADENENPKERLVDPDLKADADKARNDSGLFGIFQEMTEIAAGIKEANAHPLEAPEITGITDIPLDFTSEDKSANSAGKGIDDISEGGSMEETKKDTPDVDTAKEILRSLKEKGILKADTADAAISAIEKNSQKEVTEESKELEDNRYEAIDDPAVTHDKILYHDVIVDDQGNEREEIYSDVPEEEENIEGELEALLSERDDFGGSTVDIGKIFEKGIESSRDYEDGSEDEDDGQLQFDLPMDESLENEGGNSDSFERGDISGSGKTDLALDSPLENMAPDEKDIEEILDKEIEEAAELPAEESEHEEGTSDVKAAVCGETKIFTQEETERITDDVISGNIVGFSNKIKMERKKRAEEIPEELGRMDDIPDIDYESSAKDTGKLPKISDGAQSGESSDPKEHADSKPDSEIPTLDLGIDEAINDFEIDNEAIYQDIMANSDLGNTTDKLPSPEEVEQALEGDNEKQTDEKNSETEKEAEEPEAEREVLEEISEEAEESGCRQNPVGERDEEENRGVETEENIDLEQEGNEGQQDLGSSHEASEKSEGELIGNENQDNDAANNGETIESLDNPDVNDEKTVESLDNLDTDGEGSDESLDNLDEDNEEAGESMGNLDEENEETGESMDNPDEEGEETGKSMDNPDIENEEADESMKKSDSDSEETDESIDKNVPGEDAGESAESAGSEDEKTKNSSVSGDSDKEQKGTVTDEELKVFNKYFKVGDFESNIRHTIISLVDGYEDNGRSDKGNIAVLGAEKTGKTSIAIEIIRMVNKKCGRTGRRLAKIKAAALNKRGFKSSLEKLYGCDLIIEDAQNLGTDTFEEIIQSASGYTDNMIIALEGDAEAVNELLLSEPAAVRIFDNEIVLKDFEIDEWVSYGVEYAGSNGYAVDDLARLALYKRVDDFFVANKGIGKTDVEKIIDAAIKKSKHLNKKIKGIFVSRKAEDGLRKLEEKDFN